MNKVISIDQAIDKLHDGASIMIGGFLGIGSPLKCIDAILKKGVKDLTLIAVVSSYPGGKFDLAPLFEQKRVKKFITSHTGTCPELQAVFRDGEIEVEYYPMGTWAEKIRCGGAGLGAVLTPIGIGTMMEEGKQKLTIEGKEYLLEPPLKAEFGFIKGWKADKMGNIEYRGISMNCNPVMATATKYTVAEVNEIVEIGELDPIRVGTPGIFVNGVVQGNTLAEQEEILKDQWIRTKQLKA